MAEFGKTDWQSFDPGPPPSDPKQIYREIDYLVGPAMDQRSALAAEIMDQDARLLAYFAEALMLSVSGHPNTIKILEMTDHVGYMVAIYYKLQYNRGRPQQVCPALMPLLPSPWHASYPSGHSLESHLIALALSEVVPGARDMLTALAKRIGENREVAGVHFPSDTKAGCRIAHAMHPYLKECRTFLAVLEDARREH